MKRFISRLWCIAICSSLLNTGSVKAQPPTAARETPAAVRTGAAQTRHVSDAEREVRKLERAWLDAYEQRDAEAMNTIVADDFIITFPNGAVQGKALLMESLRLGDPARPSPKYYAEDVRARVYGDTVILTGRVVAEYQRGGETVSEQSRYTDTYVKRQGRWQVVASHLSNVARSQQLTTQTPASANDPLVLSNVTVIDGTGGRPQPRMTLVISGGRIADMFIAGRKRLPAGATVLDLSGHYVLPGLIDSHYHLMPGMRGKDEEAARRRFALLGGVTAVRDMAGDAIALAELAREAADGRVPSPRIYFSAVMRGTLSRLGEISHGLTPGTAPWARLITPEIDIARTVAEAKRTGATGIKLYSDLNAEQVRRITAEAHRQGLRVWAHAAVYPAKPSEVVAAGVDAVSHSDFLAVEGLDNVPNSYQVPARLVDWNKVVPVDSEAITAVLRRMRKEGAILDPTLTVINEILTRQLAVEASQRFARDPQRFADWSYAVTKRAHQLGVTLVAGTDIPEQPRSRELPNIHTELELLVTKAGLTPLEAITTATRNGAQALGILDSYGTITKRKIADLVVLSADPSIDIRNTAKIIYVIKGGRVYKR